MVLKVTIRWSEEVSYSSEIDITDDDVAAMRQDGYIFPDEEPDAAVVERWLRDQEEHVWFEQTDTSADFRSVDERSLDEVASVKGA